MYKKEDTTLELIVTTPTHWSCEQLPPLQLKKEVCTEGDTNMMAKAPNSPTLPGTGSMGELSQNSLKLLLMYGSTPFGTLSQQFGYYFGQSSLLLLLR